jgi:hypothetical protein
MCPPGILLMPMFECLRYRAPEVLLQSSVYDSAVGMGSTHLRTIY